MFEEILVQELDFTISELKKLNSINNSLNIDEQLITNSIMFKENLKIITSQCIELTWRK